MPEFWEELTQWWESVIGMHAILKSLLLLVIGIAAVKIVITFVNRALKRSKLEKAAHGLIRSVIQVVLYCLLGFIIASALGIDVTGVVALASVVSLAISLALQDCLTNLIGGFILLSTHPFASGDYVEVAEQSGTVQEIGMAYTKLITPDNKAISIPNSTVIASNVVNYTVTGTRRLDINITTAYDAPIEKVLAALREAADVPEKLQEKGIFAEVMEYGDKGISYSVRVWTTGADYWSVKFAINRRIHTVFAREGLTMSYPQLTVHMDEKH